jgi:N-methylhydantoinase B
LLADCEFGAQFDRVKFPPPGLHGGLPGAAARIILERDGVATDLPGKVSGYRLRRGDRVTVLTQGGGGLGDPRERDPQALARDLAYGKVSRGAAERDYGASRDMAP